MATLEIHPDNSVAVQITLSNPILGAFVNDSTVTAEIQDGDGGIVKASFSLPYVAASDGIYRSTIPPVAGLTLGVIYSVIFDATGADSLIGNWLVDIKATRPGVS